MISTLLRTSLPGTPKISALCALQQLVAPNTTPVVNIPGVQCNTAPSQLRPTLHQPHQPASFPHTSFRLYSSVPESGSSEAPIGNEKVQKLADEISGLSVLECSWLTQILRKKLGIERSAMSMMPMMSAAPAAAPAAADEAPKEEKKEEKKEFDLKLESFAAEAKIKIIKEVRALTSLGLKEAKELVEKAPVVIKNALPKADAEAMLKQLEAVGAKVVLE